MADRELRAKSLPENHPQLKGAASPEMSSPTGADGIRWLNRKQQPKPVVPVQDISEERPQPQTLAEINWGISYNWTAVYFLLHPVMVLSSRCSQEDLLIFPALISFCENLFRRSPTGDDTSIHSLRSTVCSSLTTYALGGWPLNLTSLGDLDLRYPVVFSHHYIKAGDQKVGGQWERSTSRPTPSMLHGSNSNWVCPWSRFCEPLFCGSGPWISNGFLLLLV